MIGRAPQPRSQALMICWSASVKVGSEVWGSVSPSMSRSSPNKIWTALKIGLGRAVDELGDDHLAFADLPPTTTILGDHDELVQRLGDQGLHILGAGRAGPGIVHVAERNMYDSPLEGDGFELLVLRHESHGFPEHPGHRGYLYHPRGRKTLSRRRVRRSGPAPPKSVALVWGVLCG